MIVEDAPCDGEEFVDRGVAKRVSHRDPLLLRRDDALVAEHGELLRDDRLVQRQRFLQFPTELYNAWNHTQFSSVDTSARFAPDGRQSNARFGSMIAAAPARQMQLSLRFTF